MHRDDPGSRDFQAPCLKPVIASRLVVTLTPQHLALGMCRRPSCCPAAPLASQPPALCTPSPPAAVAVTSPLPSQATFWQVQHFACSLPEASIILQVSASILLPQESVPKPWTRPEDSQVPFVALISTVVTQSFL